MVQLELAVESGEWPNRNRQQFHGVLVLGGQKVRLNIGKVVYTLILSYAAVHYRSPPRGSRAIPFKLVSAESNDNLPKMTYLSRVCIHGTRGVYPYLPMATNAPW